MGKGEEVQTPKRFKWLRRIFNRIRYRHSKFRDGKYTKRSKDIEKWRDDSDLTKADYPDYRWQVLTKGKARRMVPSMTETENNKSIENQNLSDKNNEHHHDKVKINDHDNHQHHHDHDHGAGHKCACHTLKELGMIWYEPKPSDTRKSEGLPHSTANRTSTVTAELHNVIDDLQKRLPLENLQKSLPVEEIMAEAMKELKIGKQSIQQRFMTTTMYKTLDSADDDNTHIDTAPPVEYPNLRMASKQQRLSQARNDANGAPRYVPLPSTSQTDPGDGIELDLTEVITPAEPENTNRHRVHFDHQGQKHGGKDTASLDPFNISELHNHNLQAESDNDKNHLKSVKGFNDKKAKKDDKIVKKSNNTPKKPKTPKRRRSLKQRAERKLRKYTVPKGYHKLKEEDVDEDILLLEHDMNVKKANRKLLKRQNAPEWMIAQDTLDLRAMGNVHVRQPPHYHQHHHQHQHHSQSQQHHRHQKQLPTQNKNNNSGKNKTSSSSSTRDSAPLPRGSPRAKKGSPRHILYQMQQEKKNLDLN